MAARNKSRRARDKNFNKKLSGSFIAVLKRHRRLTTLAALILFAGIGSYLLIFSQAATGSSIISGTAYQDLNRNGIQDPDEAPMTNQHLYLFDSAGQLVGGTYTDSTGRYQFSGLANGTYRLEYDTSTWWSLRNDWVPTTTVTLYPKFSLNLFGSAAADFGWRKIVRSTDVNSPISSFTGPNGMKVQSYNDVVEAKNIYDAVMLGTVGPEARFVTIRFDISPNASTAAGWQGSPGSFSNYSAICYNNYISWISNSEASDNGVSHEYGHAWSLYYDTIVQQEGNLAAYLKARGLYGDSRINTSYMWSARELVAEDYRQLLGSPTAQKGNQMNFEIPPASQVAGLKDFLLNVFTKPGSGGGTVPPPPQTQSVSITSLAFSPNPIKASSKSPGMITFSLSENATTTVAILDSANKSITTLVNNQLAPMGQSSLVWDLKNDKGRKISRGTYTVRVQATGADGVPVVRTYSFKVL